MAGSFGYGPLLGKPVIKPAFPLSGQCAGLISTLRISVCCAAGGGGSHHRLQLKACALHPMQAEVSPRSSSIM